MRITFVLPRNNFSGGIRVTALFAAELKARGHEVTLVAQPMTRPTLRRRAKALLRGQRLVAKKPGPYLDDFADSLKIIDRPRPVTDADLPDADVVIATWWETAAPVAALSRRKGAKIYFMQDYGGPNQEFEKLIPTWRLPFTFITLTSALRDAILEHNPRADVFIVRNAVDTDRFPSAPREMPEAPTFGLLWRNHPSKGIDVAVEAISRARHRDRISILAFGPAAGARYSRWPERTEYIPRPEDEALPGIYGRCTAWLFPSRMEGFGLPITEAMACRTPVIGTRAGAGPDLIETGRNGWLVDVEDADAMARAIDAMVEMMASEWQAMSEAAYATVADYGWSDAAAHFEAALLHATGASAVAAARMAL